MLYVYGIVKQVDNISDLENSRLLIFEVIFATVFLLYAPNITREPQSAEDFDEDLIDQFGCPCRLTEPGPAKRSVRVCAVL